MDVKTKPPVFYLETFSFPLNLTPFHFPNYEPTIAPFSLPPSLLPSCTSLSPPLLPLPPKDFVASFLFAFLYLLADILWSAGISGMDTYVETELRRRGDNCLRCPGSMNTDSGLFAQPAISVVSPSLSLH